MLRSAALFIAFGLTGPACAAQAGSALTIGNWAVACDNGWRCEAILANQEAVVHSTISIRIVRDGGIDSTLRLSFFPGASHPDGKSFRPETMEVAPNNLEALPETGSYDGQTLIYEGDVAADLLRAATASDALRLSENGGLSVTLPTHGLMAVLLYFDTVQHRIGNESAIIAKGAEPGHAVAQPPQFSVISVPPPSERPPRRMALAQVNRHRRAFPCGTREPFAKTTSGVDYYRLDAATSLALVMPMCSLSNYNSFVRVILIDEAGNSRVAPIEGEGSEKLGENLVGGYWDEERRRLISFGRWNGQCGNGVEYAWDGTQFRIVEEQVTASCELEISAPLTVWRAIVAQR